MSPSSFSFPPRDPTWASTASVPRTSTARTVLRWKMPEDDGGKQISRYEVEKMDESTGAWLPAGNPKGFSWDLRNLVEGRSYKFLVRAVNEDGDSPNLETEDSTIAKNEFDVPTKPGKPKAKNW